MLKIGDRLIETKRPLVMGVVNVTPDSFYSGSRAAEIDALIDRVARMLAAGASVIDIGGCSTRPDSTPATVDQELERLIPAIKAVRCAFPDAVISADTFRGEVARKAVEAGADIINDVGGLNPDMEAAVAELGVPYVLTDTGLAADTPEAEVTPTVIQALQTKLRGLTLAGVADVIVDPGFGFGKTLRQNYILMRDLRAFSVLGCPVLVGISRKSMLTIPLGIEADDALNATTALNTVALERGASILRVHDVAAAVEAVKIHQLTL